jgi:hypothetical protein
MQKLSSLVPVAYPPPNPMCSYRGIMRQSIAVLCTVLILGAGPAASAAVLNFIQNGSFEDPAFASDSIYYQQPTAWYGTPIPIIFRGSSSLAPPPVDGAQFFGLGTAGYSVSQTFSVDASGLYTLSYYVRGYEPAASTGPSGLQVSIGGNTVDTALVDRGGDWQFRSVSIELIAGSHTLEFVCTTPNATVIDKVSLVPEPYEYGFVAILASLSLAFRTFSRRVANSYSCPTLR